MSNKTPVTIFTGFLGSGKTTIIMHLVDELQKRGEQVAYIKNELGEQDIDSQMVQGEHIQTKELLNGCICCTLTGPFLNAIDELIEKYLPDRIVIEASGTADASALALMVQNHPTIFRDAVLTVIDVLNFEGFLDLTQTARNQTKFTDFLIFNKVELVDEDRTRAVVGYVRELNTHSPIVEAPNGKLPADFIFSSTSSQLTDLLNKVELDHHHNDQHLHDHLEHDDIQALNFYSDKIVDTETLDHTLSSLPKNVFRVKGVLMSNSGQILIQKVAQRLELTHLDHSLDLRPGLIIIGFKVEHNKEEIFQALTNMFEKAQP